MAIAVGSERIESYRSPPVLWILVAASILASLFIAREGFELATGAWFSQPEYSHGVLIPVIAAFLIWQRREWLSATAFSGSWLGVAVVIVGIGVWLAGNLSTIYTVSQYAIVIVVYGIVLSLVGTRVFAKLLVPMLMLLLTIPLPQFLYANLSSELQLISSRLGVAFIRLFGISVLLNGNVIDLGHFQMQVVEACDGLRYLFPLMTLGFIVAYFFRAPLWQRALVFLSSVPITILMNSLRIGMIGVFAEYGNTTLAEGLLHDLQGWVIFMASGALMLLEIWLITKLFMRGANWRDVLAFDLGKAPRHRGTPSARRRIPVTLATSTIVLAAATLASILLPERVEAYPARSWFIDFPLRIGDWRGTHGRLENIYLEAIKVDDYLLADYTDGPHVVNVYSAYLSSQRQGASIHSPRSCLPGGGWRITEFGQAQIPTDASGSGTFTVNRALIELGSNRQLVYYWFKQRDREITNEYAAKWYIFVDALTRRRTDGALIRLTAPLSKGEGVEHADARLREFARLAREQIGPFVPD